jgi:transposase
MPFSFGEDMAHRRGESRGQAALFPVMLDDLVAPDAMVRVIDAWVESLDMHALGFAKAQANAMGRPPYDPADLLKLYLWGYLSAVRSSRALERECHRNVECMWLLGRMAPDHKTIAEFRRCNPQALIAVCAAFVQFARGERLIAGTTLAIDGTKIRAVASRKAIGDARGLERERDCLIQEVHQYLKRLDESDAQDDATAHTQGDVLKSLKRLHKRQVEIAQELERMAQSRSNMTVQTEPEARVMKALHGAPGYNLQTAVDTDSHMIVHHEVCNDASDLRQLAPMAQASAGVLDAKPVVVADAGYANGEQLHTLGTVGITAYVAPCRAVNNQGEGTFYDKGVFVYDRQQDAYTCPAGQRLQRNTLMKHKKLVIYAGSAEVCGTCTLKRQCTGAAQRSVSRHMYEDALQACAQRVNAKPEMMQLRRQTAEHPFATLKHQILGNARLLVRGMQAAAGELSLAVLAYNLKRAVNINGARWMQHALQG